MARTEPNRLLIPVRHTAVSFMTITLRNRQSREQSREYAIRHDKCPCYRTVSNVDYKVGRRRSAACAGHRPRRSGRPAIVDFR
jgi:hypothetical protein